MNAARFWRIAKRDGGPQCYYCDRILEVDTATADHWWPRELGGTDDDRNIVLACSRCNHAKANKRPSEWPRSASLPPPPGWTQLHCVKADRRPKLGRQHAVEKEWIWNPLQKQFVQRLASDSIYPDGR